MLTDTEKAALVDELADVEHQRWADWQSWCHKVLRENCPSPELEAVLERWDHQIATPYADLSEREKGSDREEVERYMPIIERIVESAYQRGRHEHRAFHGLNVPMKEVSDG